jgi:hypothetical protein
VQAGGEPLGRSRIGRATPVSSMPLKGTREARGKPPRGGAWLRDHPVSSHDVDFNLRGKLPLSQDLARWDSRCVSRAWYIHLILRSGVVPFHRCQDDLDKPDVLHIHRGACSSRYRLLENHPLSDPTESIIVNMGDPSDDAKESGRRRVETLSENLRCGWRESAWP